MTELTWLPEHPDWRNALKLARDRNPPDRISSLVSLSRYRLDLMKTNLLGGLLGQFDDSVAANKFSTKPIKLAVLGSCTLAQVYSAIRVAGLRREILVSIYEADYGQYWQELINAGSGIYKFRPNVILFALDAYHLAAGVEADMHSDHVSAALKNILDRIGDCWRRAREAFSCPIIQQTPLPVHPTLLGNNEHRMLGSKASFIARLNSSLRPLADEMKVDLLALDDRVVRDGIAAWHDLGLWHRAKQEISPSAAPMYGELMGRLLAAQQGRSFKALVMDLDNTLWGGAVGDDGMENLVLGQGSALGEAFVAFQEYALELSRRGIILAVCSKNDEANALEPFTNHPEMVLRRRDIACFVANWSDKATNIRSIAQQLNIGLDALVFIDDNPFERSLVRTELPMVGVPEVGDDPAVFAQVIADGGYFESLAITQEDVQRSRQYQSNELREVLKASSTDLRSYLRDLDMQLTWRKIDRVGLSRTVQLINKTNQFNLTTRRYTDEDVISLMNDSRALGLQLRLRDRFGDNGIISIVIGRMQNDTELCIDTWLMSCRVLGRHVERATLNLLALQARLMGACQLIGDYIPTKKNAMVKDHYANLGFTLIEARDDGFTRAVLNLETFTALDTFISVCEG